MNKIIQFLRLSRLVLLVILLLIAVIAKIARADIAVLYYAGSGNVKGNFAATPLAACKLEYPETTIAKPYGDGRDAGYCLSLNQANNQVHWGNYSSMNKTCDAKELTNPNPPFGYESLKDLFIFKAPQGDDAALWFPDKFSSCENNCVVRNTRYYTKGKDGVPKASVTEADGSSRSVFYKRQTGEVCVPEKPKKNDPPKPPAPDNNNGGSQGNSGSDNGQGNQSNGSGGESSSGGTGSGSGSTSNQGSGNSDGGGSSGGGSGGGSGGVNGSGGQTGPSGGGTSGGESGGNESSGSEGSDGDGESGSGENSGPGSEGSGQGGDGSSGEGPVGNGQSGDSGEAGGHYFPCPSGKGSYKKGTEPSAECLGNGDGKGEGSIGGGSCEADTPPDCKGDPIQCYIAREQWRTACAASGKSNKIEGQGNCERLIPPECKGDETQCYIAKQQFISACEAQAQYQARNSLKEYADGKSGIISDVESSSEDGVKQALEDNGGKIDLNNIINKSGYGWSRSCPASATIDAGVFGTFEIDNSMLCTMAQVLGKIFAALCMLFAVRYIFA